MKRLYSQAEHRLISKEGSCAFLIFLKRTERKELSVKMSMYLFTKEKKKTFVFKLREESFLRFFKAVLKLGSLS